jgi:hypothetical protein
MVQRLSWYVHLLEQDDQERHPPLRKIINTGPPQHRRESSEEILHSWRTTKKDSFEEGNAGVAQYSLGDPAPTQVVAMSTQRVIVFPKFLDKLQLITTTGNIGMDSVDRKQS